MRLVALLNQMRALGMAIPADLAEMETNLAEEFVEEAAEAEKSPAGPKK
jgi:hypothetical protein